MALNYNGTSPLFIDYNGTSIHTLSYNGTEVWWREPLITNLWNQAASKISRSHSQFSAGDYYTSLSDTQMCLWFSSSDIFAYICPYTTLHAAVGTVDNSNVETAIRWITNNSSGTAISGNYVYIETSDSSTSTGSYPSYPACPALNYYVVVKDTSSANSGGISYQLLEVLCDQSPAIGTATGDIIFGINPAIQLAAPIAQSTAISYININNPNPYTVKCYYGYHYGSTADSFVIGANSTESTSPLSPGTTYYFYFEDIYGNCSDSSVISAITDSGY